MCYGAEAPWRIMGIPEDEVETRVDLTDDQCVIDEKSFFIRGHIPIPVLDSGETFLWSVWCSLSERSFLHACDRWNDSDRMNDPPYFGWLMSRLPGYPDTIHLQTSVQSRAVGLVPHITVLEPSQHPLVLEQRDGITMDRVQEFAHIILHEQGGA